MKTCKTCGTEKEKDDFCKKSRECKECHNKRKRNAKPKKEKVKLVRICKVCGKSVLKKFGGYGMCLHCYNQYIWRRDHPEVSYHCSVCGVKVGKNNKSSLCETCYGKEYKKKNKNLHNKNYSKYIKEYFVKNPTAKFISGVRILINRTLKLKNYTKRSRTYALLGCSYEEFISYLGSKPEGKIHLDHICPAGQAQNEEEAIKLQHYTNFRWLSAEENISKSDKRTPEGEKMCVKLLNREWIDQGGPNDSKINADR